MSLADLSSPAAIKAALKEYDLLGRDKVLELYGFGRATGYMLRDGEKEYDSKAIAGIAHKYQFPDSGPLQHQNFSGGISARGAAQKLSSLGFEIVGLKKPRNDWSLNECQQTVSTYFDALQDQLRGKEINKAAIYRELALKVGRPRKAVEYKFQNIDAILSEEDFPRLGKSVAKNYQQLLRGVVMDYVALHDEVFETQPPHVEVPDAFADVLVEPPRGNPQYKKQTLPLAKHFAIIRDFEANRKLGKRGEEWVIKLERKRLTAAGRQDLADKLIWVSQEEGDPAGYDILSFGEDGKQIVIEVKTTNGGIHRAFFITANELAVAKKWGKQFHLYRVFNFSRGPRLYRLLGTAIDPARLIPVVFRVVAYF